MIYFPHRNVAIFVHYDDGFFSSSSFARANIQHLHSAISASKYNKKNRLHWCATATAFDTTVVDAVAAAAAVKFVANYVLSSPKNLFSRGFWSYFML